MDGVAVKPLTVSFHEAPFLTKLSQENQFGFWFELSDEARRQAGSPWGPSNPQALNRYSYVQNNPLKYTDPTGHQQATTQRMTAKDLDDLTVEFDREMNRLRTLATGISIVGGAVAGIILGGWPGVALGVTLEVALITAINEQDASVKNFLSDIEDVLGDNDSFEIIDTGRSLYAIIYNEDGSVKTTVRPDSVIWSGAVRNGLMEASRNFD